MASPDDNDHHAGLSDAGDSGETYALEDHAPKPPSLPGRVVTASTVDDLLDRVAADLVLHCEACMREFGDVHLALSSDERLETLFRRLMIDPNYRRLPWRRTHLWLAQEQGGRCFQQIRETIVDHADIPLEQAHPVPIASPDPARDYERELCDVLAWREKGHDRLDYVLLALGPGGEIGGIGIAGLEDGEQLIRGAGGPDERRVAMTLKLINAARFIAVVGCGVACGEAVQLLDQRIAAPDELPANRLAPIDGQLTWYLDADACGGRNDNAG